MKDAAFDLSMYELELTGKLTIQTAKGDDDLLGIDGLPVIVEMYGPGSTQAVKAAHKAGQRASVRVQQLVRGKVNKRESEIAEEEEIERLCALTKSISANFPVSPEDVYSNPGLIYFTDQVIAFAKERGNFSKG